MEYLYEFAEFAGKTLVIVVAFGVILSLIASLAVKYKQDTHLDIENLNKRFENLANGLKSALLDKKAFKNLEKKQKKKKKKKDKQKDKRNIFVLEFDGDIKASSVEYLADEITTVINVAQPGDEVVLCLESPGGVVHGYGLAAAQLMRFKENGLKLTVCVDKVAASGGYLMACTADKIIAAPFAILGSIGVLAQIPNFNRFLKSHNVDYQEITAGEYKRTVSLFGEITDDGKKKFTEQIEDTHGLFKEFVKSHRPQLELEKVATGEHWFGTRAKELNLLDEISTSNEYLYKQKDVANMYKLKMAHKKKLVEKLTEAVSLGVAKALEKTLHETTINKT